MNDPRQPDLRELAADYFLRELTPGEQEALEWGLARDPALRAHFAELARDEWLLHHVHHVEEENVVPVPTARPRWARWAAVAAGFMALLSAGLFLASNLARNEAAPELTGPVAVVSDLFVLDGDAVTVVQDGEARTLRLGDTLHSGDRLATPPSSRLVLRYEGEDTTIRVAGESAFELKDEQGAKHIQLRRGVLRAEVAEQPADRPMRILTQDAEAVVLGTTFEIAAHERTRLAVIEGRVQLRSVAGEGQVTVNGGFIAEASRAARWLAEPFRLIHHTPVYDGTVNDPGGEEYIVVDPVRRAMGLMTFNLGQIDGEIREARLRLRVVRKDQDVGGAGNVRLFRTEPDADWSSGAPVPRVEISHYRGKVGAGMDLEFNIPPDQLSNGVLTLLLTLDRKGNDFWFSSSEGAVAPELTLQVVGGGR